MNSILTLLISALIACGLLVIKKCASLKQTPMLKILVIVYCLVGFVRYFLSDSFVEVVFDGADIFSSLLRTFHHISYAVLPMAVFFKRRIFRNIAVYFDLPVAVVAAVAFDRTFAYFTAEGGGGYYIGVLERTVFYMSELVLAIVIPLLLALGEGHRINARSPKEWILTYLSSAVISWIMMPSYIIQSTIGFTGLSSDTYGNMHLGWILYMIVIPIIAFHVFKRRSMEEKHELCIFLSIAQMYHTMSIFLRGFTYSRIPLQLCCIAAFLYFIAIALKHRKMFDFCYVSNMVGAFIAIAIASFSSDALSFWNVHYMQEHTFVVVVPLLAYSLGLFPRLDTKALRHVIPMFSAYFIFCLVLGSMINTLVPDGTGFTVNYFYMFNNTVAIEYVPFASFVNLIELKIAGISYFPILIVVVYIVFVLLCALFFYGNLAGYAIKDRLSGVKRGKPEIAEYTSAIRRL